MQQISKKIIKSHDNLDLYYEVCDNGDGKTSLFFLHGVGGDLDAWRFVQNALLEQGFSTVAMDLRGHGYSGHPRTHQNYSMEALISDVTTILEAENLDKIILIGHSFGAVVAYHFALKNPEKIEKLILISPIFHSPGYLRHPTAKKLAYKLISILAKISPSPLKPGHSKYPAGKFHKDYEWTGLVRTIIRNSLRSYLLNSQLTIDLDEKLDLRNLPEKTLIIAGEKDSIARLAETQKIQENISGSKLEVIKDANHVVILNNSQQVTNSLFDFIR